MCIRDRTNDNQTKSGIIDAFVESVENDSEPAVSGKSVLSAMKAIFGSLKSSELGRTVRVDCLLYTSRCV